MKPPVCFPRSRSYITEPNLNSMLGRVPRSCCTLTWLTFVHAVLPVWSLPSEGQVDFPMTFRRRVRKIVQSMPGIFHVIVLRMLQYLLSQILQMIWRVILDVVCADTQIYHTKLKVLFSVVLTVNLATTFDTSYLKYFQFVSQCTQLQAQRYNQLVNVKQFVCERI